MAQAGAALIVLSLLRLEKMRKSAQNHRHASEVEIKYWEEREKKNLFYLLLPYVEEVVWKTSLIACPTLSAIFGRMCSCHNDYG